jgi:hypothetical protein
MMAAVERGLWPGVDGCVGTRTIYDQFPFSKSAIDLALGLVRPLAVITADGT